MINCIICKRNKFIKPPWIKHKSKKKMCIFCRSLSRHRAFIYLYEQYLHKKINFNNKNCLVFSEKINNRISYYLKKITNTIKTADIENGYDLKINLENMKSIKNDTYDCIFIFHVLSAIKNDVFAIQELYRILKPNGYIFINDGLAITPISYGVNNVVQRLHSEESLKNFLLKYFNTSVLYSFDPLSLKKETYFILQKTTKEVVIITDKTKGSSL
jgi:SAM-dependent methyltransferase